MHLSKSRRSLDSLKQDSSVYPQYSGIQMGTSFQHKCITAIAQTAEVSNLACPGQIKKESIKKGSDESMRNDTLFIDLIG